MLTQIWSFFLDELENEHSAITSVIKKDRAQIPFVYITTKEPISLKKLNSHIKVVGTRAMKGKRMNMDLHFVRQQENLYVYRIRFLVPNEKMFCCGNGCFDCIRFT
ncbi:hypothetical protein [Alkalihalobacillus sp. LMS39]|uniref:hypothetical protein n=1 Tax=Alkalihalobacillus sp. LMS39 TaxID=2924032 RepID=UPI001FB1AC83|nr:hypothetical protein [Alkalihalobacillus sp. LMS39]UOE92954.1 hypothetical protein MM271_17255 [Alkalihalobacillus sp. LMS39]